MLAAARKTQQQPRVPFYKTPDEPRTEQLNLRIAKSTEKALQDLARLWTLKGQAETGNPKVKVSVQDAVLRLIDQSLDGAFQEMGGRPESDDEWDAAEKLAFETFAPKKKK